MLQSSSPLNQKPPEVSQKCMPERLRGWLYVFGLALVLVLSLISTGCGSSAPGNTTTTPPQSVPTTTCTVPLFEQMRFSTAQQDGKVLYAAYAVDTSFTQEGVVALNPLTQHVLWQHVFSVNANAAMRLTAADGIVYALLQRTNTDWSWLFALDAQTGQQLWTYNEQGADDLAVCNGALALVGNWSLHVFDGRTGKLLWTYGQPDRSERLGSTLAFTKDTLYFLSIALDGGEQAAVHAMNLQNGQTRWQAALPPNDPAVSGTAGSLTLTAQALYVLQSSLTEPGHLVALRPQDGGQIWSADSAPDEQILMASNQTLYLANPGQLDAFQTADGNHLWSQRLGGPGMTVTSVLGSPQLGLFMTENADALCSLDLLTGTTNWCLQQAFSDSEGTPFFIDNTAIYLVSGDFDNLYVVDRQTGKVRSHFQIHALTDAITTL